MFSRLYIYFMKIILYKGCYLFKLIPVLHLMVKAAAIILAYYRDFIQRFTDFAILSSNSLINKSELLPIILTSRLSWLRSKMNILLKIIWRVSDILNVVATGFSCVIKRNSNVQRWPSTIWFNWILAATSDKNTLRKGTIRSKTHFTILIKWGFL